MTNIVPPKEDVEWRGRLCNEERFIMYQKVYVIINFYKSKIKKLLFLILYLI